MFVKSLLPSIAKDVALGTVIEEYVILKARLFIVEESDWIIPIVI